MSEPRLPPDITSALTAAFARPAEQPLEDVAFDRLARRIFEFQFARNSPYAAYCERRGCTPDRVQHWTEIPAVPTAAFKEVALIAGRPELADAVFRTSGTTQGHERRGTHYIVDIALYHGALLPHFAAMVLPDGVRPAMLSLVPRPREMPDSSLAHMIATVIEGLGSAGSGWYASVARGIHEAELRQALQEAEQRGEAVCLLGTSWAFVHWIDATRAAGARYRLPAGSRLMDTGGFKGRSREISSEAMRRAALELLEIADTHCVNEYGMTEMCSQFYEAALRDHIRQRTGSPRRMVAPAWVRTRVMEPETLQPAEPGRPGLLCHYDLANAGSVMVVQTEDLGEAVEGGGFRVLGRASGATPRGCSLAMEELLAATRGQRV
jgi:hypothetical protein